VDDVLPEGPKYQANFLSPEEEQDLLSEVKVSRSASSSLGLTGKRGVVSFGWRYDFNGAEAAQSDCGAAFDLSPSRALAHRLGAQHPRR
jgi:hypothetical protein